MVCWETDPSHMPDDGANWESVGNCTTTLRPLFRLRPINNDHFTNDVLKCIFVRIYCDFNQICSQGSNWQKYNFGSDNSLALSRRQAIIWTNNCLHNNDVIMSAMAPLITGASIVHSSVSWGTDQRNHQSSVSLAFVTAIHRWPVNTPHTENVSIW